MYEENTLKVLQNKEFLNISYANILYVKAERNYVSIVTYGKQQHLIRHKITELQQLLPEQHFTRVHRSYVVNVNHVKKITASYIIIDELKIPIGRSYRLVVDRIIASISNN